MDGFGAERVISAIQGANLGLRRVEEADCRLLWEWANEPEVRSASFSSIRFRGANIVSGSPRSLAMKEF